ncbi:L-fuculose-phosphate aldolase [Tepidanaerobacter syntrophicus]|uniref:L-fuculose-phosphate aldolase n=1 Tax=Tepidanaerobacter syntrophicus TaxID=224999 RepID=A0A0U9HGT0_9FIRM|nr:L-fuculose-phosphate aldolase [Tepidanaerobacter syntrophicus]GAQ25901.1 L-fuculose-phosphate aldolase [Tepidanaerobacter syntrophicus]
MLLEAARKEIIDYGKKLIESKLTRGTGGNISMCDREKNIMAITPSGIDYFKIEPEQIVLIDVETGDIKEGDTIPSSECEMHRIFYKYREDVNAVIHTHATFAASISCLNQSLPPLHYLVGFAGLNVRCAPYATYGTVELAKNAFEAMKDRKACLLANHGLLAVGTSLAEAFAVTEQIEFCCELYYRAKSIGEPVILPEDEMIRVMERFKNYGQRVDNCEKI